MPTKSGSKCSSQDTKTDGQSHTQSTEDDIDNLHVNSNHNAASSSENAQIIHALLRELIAKFSSDSAIVICEEEQELMVAIKL